MTSSSPPSISVIVVTHQRPAFLAECLKSIAAQDFYDKELTVIINPKDDRSEAIARQYTSNIIRTHTNIGAFPAVNLGIANTDGPRIMVVDDDATFQSTNTLSRLCNYLDDNPDCLIATCNIQGPCENPPYPLSQAVHTFKNGFALFDRRVFTEVAGYFPDRFFRAGGESYISGYVADAGFKIMVVADVWMNHAQTLTARSTHAMNHFAIRNHALLVLLQDPLRYIIPSLSVKMVTSFIRIAIQRRNPIAWFTGWNSFCFNICWALQHRKPIKVVSYRTLRKVRRTHAGHKPIIHHGSYAKPLKSPSHSDEFENESL